MPKSPQTVSDRLEQQRQEVRFRVLRLIEGKPEISQRELADALGISLGQINYQLKSLKEKGLIKAGNFLRSDNKLAYAYLLTPKGVADKLAITKHFLARKRQEFQLLKTELEQLESELHHDASNNNLNTNHESSE
ncbi:MarR family EPS-associated transcriptional regulator [uncultured Limnobacter sp.]|uniref:MarR family EPS-associated transcriptional regulator n=1 Tax=uncultured Limnobacter sp. TaxID=199681 RepID=UPI0030FB1BB8